LVRSWPLACLLLLAACARAVPPPVCAPGMGAPVVVYSLYFGRSVPGRSDVSDAEWRRFADDTITANLPNGYTVTDARGAWMNPVTHKTIKEGTKVLTVALPAGQDGLSAISRIRNEYQVRFRQELVGVLAEPGCGSF
jgi:hypothetical protein